MNESRKDKSLYTLTKKFVEMLKTEETVDLNIVNLIKIYAHLKKLITSLYRSQMSFNVQRNDASMMYLMS